MNLKKARVPTKAELSVAAKWICFGIEWILLAVAAFISAFDILLNELGNLLMKGAEALNRRRNKIEEAADDSKRTGFELIISAVSMVWPGLAKKQATADVVDFPPRKGDTPASPLVSEDELRALGVKGSSGESGSAPAEEPGNAAS